MRRFLKGIGTVLLFIIIMMSLLPTIVPPFLDRIHYEGPTTDHFDGEHFFNPGQKRMVRSGSGSFLARWIKNDRERAVWPEHVPVTFGNPPRRVHGDDMQVTWIGHATVLVQTRGLNILTDPIWSERASPFSFIGPKRVRASGVRFEDLPNIDLIVVSHNHYDHMDVPTLTRLWDRDKPLIVTSLGNDTILKDEGIEAVAMDWRQSMPVRPDVEIVVERNYHWSSRWGTDRNRALWSAFTIKMPGGNIFFAGDTGWGDGDWVRQARSSGPFRLLIVPIGAYEPRDFMKYSHINPEEAFEIFQMLQPMKTIGVHWGTFQLSFEPINDPVKKIAALRRKHGLSPDKFLTTEVGQTFSVPVTASAGATSK